MSEAEKERQRIMSEFYQAEGLEDPNDTFEIEEDDEMSHIGVPGSRGKRSNSGDIEMQPQQSHGKYRRVELNDSTIVSSRSNSVHQRGVKESSESKAKSKLWESIMKEAEADKDDDSDDSDDAEKV